MPLPVTNMAFVAIAVACIHENCSDESKRGQCALTIVYDDDLAVV
jgi:hypothetical protein